MFRQHSKLYRQLGGVKGTGHFLSFTCLLGDLFAFSLTTISSSKQRPTKRRGVPGQGRQHPNVDALSSHRDDLSKGHRLSRSSGPGLAPKSTSLPAPDALPPPASNRAETGRQLRTAHTGSSAEGCRGPRMKSRGQGGGLTSPSQVTEKAHPKAITAAAAALIPARPGICNLKGCRQHGSKVHRKGSGRDAPD